MRRLTGHKINLVNDIIDQSDYYHQEGVQEASKEEMLASMERGLWVTRFHYTVPVHRKLAVVTGMTRDGTFLMEKGEIAYPIKNLRFTQSYIEALANVELVSHETRLQQNWFGGTRSPALKLTGFEFTGATEF